MNFNLTFHAFVIAVTLIGVAIGRYPKLRMNRATIAFVGAVVLVLTGALSLDQAFSAIDMNTIVLLFAMMIINANLRMSGFFGIISDKVVQISHTQNYLLIIIIFTSGILSALFLNDTIVLMFTPLLLEITRRGDINPIPYLIALAASANIGSVATIIGNPQNMLIGISSGIDFRTFAFHLTPISIIGLIVCLIVIKIIYWKSIRSNKINFSSHKSTRPYKPLLYKSIIASILMLIALNIGVSITLAAIGGASLLLITRRLKPERVFREIDWTLLVFFASLFIVTHSIETTGLSDKIFNSNVVWITNDLWRFSGSAVLLSNLVSNVPAVLLFKPIIKMMINPQLAWLVLSMATTFAGNLTLIGSVANLIVAESATKEGVKLSFMEYFKAGIPITIATVILGVIWFLIIS